MIVKSSPGQQNTQLATHLLLFNALFRKVETKVSQQAKIKLQKMGIILFIKYM